MPQLDTGSLKIFYEEIGEGFPLVLINGLGSEHQHGWPLSFKRSCKEFRLITFDNRNCGKSQFFEEPFTIADMANDLILLLDHLGVEQAFIVGYSMGGLIAQYLAAYHPEYVKRLMLVSTYSTMNNQNALLMDAVKLAYESTRSRQTIFDLVYPLLFRHAYYVHSPLGDEAVVMPKERLEEPYYGWLRQYEAQRVFNSKQWLHKINQPTLVIGGSEDILVPIVDQKYLSDHIPNAKLQVIEEAGHMVSFEQPIKFTKAVIDFLRA